MNETMDAQRLRRVAELVKRACVQAALDGYEQAGLDGLCHEGAWEAAVEAIRRVDLNALLRDAGQSPTGFKR